MMKTIKKLNIIILGTLFCLAHFTACSGGNSFVKQQGDAHGVSGNKPEEPPRYFATLFNSKPSCSITNEGEQLKKLFCHIMVSENGETHAATELSPGTVFSWSASVTTGFAAPVCQVSESFLTYTCSLSSVEDAYSVSIEFAMSDEQNPVAQTQNMEFQIESVFSVFVDPLIANRRFLIDASKAYQGASYPDGTSTIGLVLEDIGGGAFNLLGTNNVGTSSTKGTGIPTDPYRLLFTSPQQRFTSVPGVLSGMTDTRSVSVWFRVGNVNTTCAAFFENTGGSNFSICGGKINITNANQYVVSYSGAGMQNNTWYNLVYSLDGSKVDLYLNGILKHTQPLAAHLSASNSAIVINRSDSVNTLEIANLQIWDIGLNANQVKTVCKERASEVSGVTCPN